MSDRAIRLGIVVVVGVAGWVGLLIAVLNWDPRPLWIVLLPVWTLAVVAALWQEWQWPSEQSAPSSDITGQTER